MTERESGAAEMAKHVYDFVEGNKDLKDLHRPPIAVEGGDCHDNRRAGTPG
jgi:hypothetical protein